jgi:hypothetical protein
MVFEVGKYYKHTTGYTISVICRANTTLFGDNALIVESNDVLRPFSAVGDTEDHSVNFIEVDKEEWMKNFS